MPPEPIPAHKFVVFLLCSFSTQEGNPTLLDLGKVQSRKVRCGARGTDTESGTKTWFKPSSGVSPEGKLQFSSWTWYKPGPSPAVEFRLRESSSFRAGLGIKTLNLNRYAVEV